MKNTILMLAGMLMLSCSEYKKEQKSDAITDQAVTKSQWVSTPKSDLYSDGKTKLIKTAMYRFQVKSVKESTLAIETAVKKYPAYISESSLKLENPILENKITIRIQSEYFQELLTDIDKQPIFINIRNIETDDLSKEFVDLDSRLKTKREVEERYMNILRKKAGTIEELLNAEKQIGALHEEIEATISRINFLKEQVNYSTINLEFYQTITEAIAQNDVTLMDKFNDAFTTGLQGLLNITLVIVYIWPIVLIIAGVLFYLIYKKKKPAYSKS